MLDTIITIIEPCRPTIVRYCPGEKIGGLGRSRSVRISIAFRPAMKKNTPIPPQVLHADHLVVGADRQVAPGARVLLDDVHRPLPEQATERVVEAAPGRRCSRSCRGCSRASTDTSFWSMSATQSRWAPTRWPIQTPIAEPDHGARSAPVNRLRAKQRRALRRGVLAACRASCVISRPARSDRGSRRCGREAGACVAGAFLMRCCAIQLLNAGGRQHQAGAWPSRRARRRTARRSGR